MSRSTPQISVLVPVHNGAATLDEQLDALASQTFDATWELVVADNRSTDASRALLWARRRAGFPAEIRVLDASGGKGAAYARNAAILAAKADRIAFCDADDRVGPRWLEGAYEALDAFDVVGGPMRRHTEPFDPDSPLLPYHSVSDDSVVTSNLAIRADVLRRAGGFDATFVGYGREDHEMAVRLWKIGARFGTDPRMSIHYRITSDQRAFVRKIYSSACADTVIWRRHPDVFPRRQGRGVVLRAALTLPVRLMRAHRGGGPRRMARVLVELAAHARMMLPPQRPLPAPRLLATQSPSLEISPPER